MADNNNLPGLSATTDPAPPPGLINASSGASTPPLSPVMPMQPAPPSQSASAVGYTPQSYNVTPEQTVSGQIKNIIASGSPLMRQAETNAKNMMQQRGLINSSTAITAGQNAVIGAAAPIATADAATYAKAAGDTTTAQNAALAAGAQAANTADITNTQVGASKAIAGLQAGTTLTAQDKQNQSQQAIAKLQADTAYQTTMANIGSAKDLQKMQGDIQTAIARLQSDTTLSAQDKQSATAQVIAQIQSNTTLTAQDKAAAAQMALATVNNASAKELAMVQANTALSIQDKQAISAQIIAGMNNTNAVTVQKLVNEGNLATIRANGEINLKVTQISNDNKLLLQTSSAASSIYSQFLANMAAVQTNPNLDATGKANALNNLVSGLNDALGAISNIANNTSVTSTLNFGDSSGTGTPTTPSGGGTPPAGSPAPPPSPIVNPSASYGPNYTQSVMSSYNAAKKASGLSDDQFLASPAAQPYVAARNTIIANTTDAATLMNDLEAAKAQAANPVTKDVGTGYVQAVTQQMQKLGIPVV